MAPNLPEALQLPYRIPIYWDPVPPWVLQVLDKGILQELAIVQIETQRAALELQMKSIDRTLKILQRK
jgi:hypothetical protein